MSQQYPEPTVGALIFNPEGEIFLMTSPIWNDKYVIPGGHVELGETLEEALKREIKEETNLNIFDVKFLVFLEFIYGKELKEQKHFIFFDYVCKTKDTAVTLNDEGTSHLWISPEKALELEIASYTKIVIERYLRNNKTRLKE